VQTSTGSPDGGKIVALSSSGYLDHSLTEFWSIGMKPISLPPNLFKEQFWVQKFTGSTGVADFSYPSFRSGYQEHYNIHCTQPSMFSGRPRWWLPIAGTVNVDAPGLTLQAYGSATARAMDPAVNYARSGCRLGYVSSTVAGSFAGLKDTVAQWFPSSGVDSGGIFMHVRVNFPTTVTNARMFIGMMPPGAPVNSEPSTWANVAGVAMDAGDASPVLLTSNASAVSKKTAFASPLSRTTMASATQYWHEFVVSSPFTVGRTVCAGYRVGIGSSAWNFVEWTGTTNTPEPYAMLVPTVLISNGAVAQAVGIDIHHIYTESAY